MQSELDATQQEYETCNSELSEREQELSEFKGKLTKLEVELKGIKAQRESDENKVRLLKGTKSLLLSMVEKKLIAVPRSRDIQQQWPGLIL